MKSYPDRGLHGRLVNELGGAIVSGQFAPGTTLDTENIASHYSASRTVVREALRVLAGKGLVDARPKKGTFVLDRSSWNLLDPDVLAWQFVLVDDPRTLERLHEVRLVVEPSAAALASQRRTDDDLIELTDAFQRIQHQHQDENEIADDDLRFHLGLLRATHNELIEQLTTLIGIGLSARDRFVHRHQLQLDDAIALHGDVLEAVQQQNPAAASDAMRRLLEAAAIDTMILRGKSSSNEGMR